MQNTTVAGKALSIFSVPSVFLLFLSSSSSYFCLFFLSIVHPFLIYSFSLLCSPSTAASPFLCSLNLSRSATQRRIVLPVARGVAKLAMIRENRGVFLLIAIHLLSDLADYEL
jgi:hypothetical protein